MCKLNRCPYEEDEHMQCEWCPYDSECEEPNYIDCIDYDDCDEFNFIY